ncbi:MAG TPA: 4-hydroxy-tetrahydrodipicolinate synthase [Anaerolineae bacterium]|nr:4-hydroxy-tetrahydrodipicolinate synthase [Anaerolineae bacterium]
MFQPYGIIPALVTPVDKNEELNEVALRRLVNFVIQGGVHGVFATGSQGEFWAFTAEEKRRIWEVVKEETAGRVPVYVGTAGLTTQEAIALTRDAELVGVDAVSILTPFFISPNQGELYEHFAAIAEATTLPIILYTNPGRTGVPLTPDTVSRLAQIPNIVGIKDSSGDLSLTAEYIRVTPETFSVLMGRDTLIFGGLVYGTKGSIAATGNVVPALVASIYDRFIAGDLNGAKEAQEALAPLRLAFSWGTFPVVIKEALNLMGLDAGPARRPVGPMPDEKREQLASVLRAMGALS